MPAPRPLSSRASLLTGAAAASVVFMAQMVPTERKVLAVFPVFLFYVVISWMIVLE